MKCLHVINNMQVNEDRFYKVKSLFQHLNKVMKMNQPRSEFINVDEIMVLYYGRRADK